MRLLQKKFKKYGTSFRQKLLHKYYKETGLRFVSILELGTRGKTATCVQKYKLVRRPQLLAISAQFSWDSFKTSLFIRNYNMRLKLYTATALHIADNVTINHMIYSKFLHISWGTLRRDHCPVNTRSVKPEGDEEQILNSCGARRQVETFSLVRLSYLKRLFNFLKLNI